MCLLSPFACPGVTRQPQPDLQVHTLSLRGRTRIVVRANDRTVVFLYRVSRSNPSAALFPRRCQPLVTRIFPGFEK